MRYLRVADDLLIKKIELIDCMLFFFSCLLIYLGIAASSHDVFGFI